MQVVLPKHLPKLTSFCNFVGNLIELPSLARLWIANCPKMHKFVSNSPCADASKDEQMNSKNLHSHIQPFFDEKVRLPSLSFLHIDEMRNMRKIWHHQLASDSFSKLEIFWVNDCDNLLNVFPSNMIGRLQKLEVLSVLRCNSVEEIFEELNISSCTMEGIVTKEEDIEAIPKFVFPQLTSLQLFDLPRLRCFYPRLYISMWPVLRILKMFGCKKVERLTSHYRSLLETHWTSPHENSQQPFFIFDQVRALAFKCFIHPFLSFPSNQT
ncbi:hypothetical protein EZV62_016058 [Acer yangbiense]|uniref:Disease resistance protein At4g27190-like leucine-rich repeats domain-containing protein n=1 Tax=Acer yangbiense TaxID=1000413 RepID=A0A5C7HN36_9ROSI|nr:hypothetical protein EZV62_016058 [Acer yangbiense]